MKNMKQLITILLLAFIIKANAQVLEITYQEEFKTVSGIGDVGDPMLQAIIQENIKNNLSKNKLILLYENGKSIYMDIPEPRKNIHQSNLEVYSGGGVYIFYKNQNEKSFVARKNILDKAFLIKEPLEEFKWQLKNKKKKIGEYNCLNAVIGNDITAWYCPDIPINDGPNIYWGLPGLIIELDSPETFYSLISVKTNSSRGSEIKPPTDGKEISSEEFNKIKKEKLGDSKGIIIQVDEM